MVVRFKGCFGQNLGKAHSHAAHCIPKLSVPCHFHRSNLMSFEVHMLYTPVTIDVGYKAPYEAKESSNPMQSCSQSQIHPSPYEAALTLANDFRTSKRACFLNLRTLNRSKSVRARLRSFWARFLAQALSCHFASIPAFSHSALTTPVRAARGSFSRTRGVRMSCASAIG